MSPTFQRFAAVAGLLFPAWAVWSAVEIVRTDSAGTLRVVFAVTGAVILTVLGVAGTVRVWREARQPRTGA